MVLGMERRVLKRVCVGVVAAVAALGGCASGGIITVTESAPVSQRIGVSGTAYGSVPARSAFTESRPRIAAPAQPAEVARPTPRPTPAVPAAAHRAPKPVGPRVDFPTDIDSELYSHQRVGKTYRVFGKRYTPRHQPRYDKTGTASWYGPKFHGKPTATGEPFDMNALSAAHKTLPLNSLVHVENLANGRSLILRINDRGPFVDDRIIDLSRAAAKALGYFEGGLQDVRVRYAGPADPNAAKAPVRAPRAVAEAPEVEAPAAIVPEAPSELPEAVRSAEAYLSLRKLAQPAADTSAPIPAPARPAPQAQAPDFSAPADLPAPQALPVPEAPQADPGTRTLTIKGPIHMARSVNLPHPERVHAATHRAPVADAAE